MKIPWIRCTDRMPPDDEDIIFKNTTFNYCRVVKLKYVANELREDMYWIPYDEATWQEVNHDD